MLKTRGPVQTLRYDRATMNAWAARAPEPLPKPFGVEDCNLHLLWLRRRVRRLERQAAHGDEEGDEEEEEETRRSAGRAPLDLGHRVYPYCGYRVQSVHRSVPCLTMHARVVLGVNVDPYIPDDDILGPGAYDTAKY